VISNTASAASATSDPNAANNDGVATSTVTASADLSVTLTDAPDPVSAGANLTYTITAANAGPSNAAAATLSDTLPAGTSFVALTSPGGWSCTTPAVGAGGTVSCSHPSMAVNSAIFTLTVSVSSGTLAGTVISNIASISATTSDPNAANNSDSEDSTVTSASGLSATKSVAGFFVAGSTVDYTIVISNAGPAAQGDNPGDEFTDVLPPQLTLVSANASSGTVVASIGTHTVTWNGTIAAAGSVIITISATINPAVAAGTSIVNQGTVQYDADGNGTNEATATTDDAAVSGASNPTAFAVGASSIPVPTLDLRMLMLLMVLVAGFGAMAMRGVSPGLRGRAISRG
jgi:uncharacterized repeat protein (TIGR01451 family)